MATGTIWQPGGLAAPTDVRDAGVGAWSRMIGVHPLSGIVGGPGDPQDPTSGPNSRQHGNNRINTQDSYAASPFGHDGGANLVGNWRDAVNPQSPLMWVMLLTIVAVGLVQLQVKFRAGGKRGVGGGLKVG